MYSPLLKALCKIHILSTFVACLTFSVLAHAQEDVTGPTEFARNSIFVELGGNGVLYSLNYDRKFTDHVSGRVGGMGFSVESNNGADRVSLLLFPTMINYLIGSGNSRLELGAGLLWGIAEGELEDYGSFNGLGLAGVTSTIGYRLQPETGGFNFRVGLTPYFSDGTFQFWGGLGLGFGF